MLQGLGNAGRDYVINKVAIRQSESFPIYVLPIRHVIVEDRNILASSIDSNNIIGLVIVQITDVHDTHASLIRGQSRQTNVHFEEAYKTI